VWSWVFFYPQPTVFSGIGLSIVTPGDLSGRWLHHYNHVPLLSHPSKTQPQRCFHEPLSVFPTSMLLLHVIGHSSVFPPGRYAVRSFYFFHCPDLVICSCHVLCWQLQVIHVCFQPLLSDLKDCSCQLIEPRNSKLSSNLKALTMMKIENWKDKPECR